MDVWNKYKQIEQISSQENIKTYKAQLEVIVKEINTQDINQYNLVKNNLQNYEDQIFELIEENNKLFLILLNDLNLDNIYNSKIKKEVYIGGEGSIITKTKINQLLEMEKAMCKIINGNKHGTGFFIKFDDNLKGLLTNNHVIDNVKNNTKICLNYLSNLKTIKITENRKAFTNKILDYTFIQIFDNDGIQDFFEIAPNINEDIKDIYILQYPNNNEISFSYGRILNKFENEIRHNASTDDGSSGSPIIIDILNKYIIGLHYGGYSGNKSKYNLGTTIHSILNHIHKQEKNEIICIYNKQETEIDLLHDFKIDIKNWSDEEKKSYLEGKKNINEENIEIYINNTKIKFNYKYKSDIKGEIQVKFKFKKLLTSTSFMFYLCYSLKSIDLSSFNTINVTNMRGMFKLCSSLKSIDLSSFNTTKVKDMS